MGQTMRYKVEMNILGFCIGLLTMCNSCNYYAKPTPGKYKYISLSQSPEGYTKDSTGLIMVLNKMVAENIKPFNSKHAYDSLRTTIYLDTILYSPDKKGIVIFIITKTDKINLKHQGDTILKYFYGANYLYGLKDSIKQDIKLFDFSSVSFINFDSYKKAKEALLEYCFGRRATDRPWNGREPRYNMDDVRFWRGDQFNIIRTDTSFIHLEE